MSMTSSSPVGPDDGKEVDWTSDPLMLGLVELEPDGGASGIGWSMDGPGDGTEVDPIVGTAETVGVTT